MKTFIELKDYIHTFLNNPNPEKVDISLNDFADVFQDIKDIPEQFHTTLGLLLILLSREKVDSQIKDYLKKRLRDEIRELKSYYLPPAESTPQ